MFDLKYFKKNDSILLLGVPWRVRLLFWGIGLFFGLEMIIKFTFFPVSALLVGMAVFAGLYTEEWLFDGERKLIVRTLGLLVFNKKKTFVLDEVSHIELRNSRQAGNSVPGDYGPRAPYNSSVMPEKTRQQENTHTNRKRGLSGLFLVLENGKEVNVHTTSIKKAQEQSELGKMISRICGIPFSA